MVRELGSGFGLGTTACVLVGIVKKCWKKKKMFKIKA